MGNSRKRMVSKLLLITGPPGVGKTSLIHRLCMLDERFQYIRPYMTRALRPGEVDKVPVSEGEMDALQSAGALLAVNQLYGVRYGTPGHPIEECFSNGWFPVLDWPITHVSIMRKAFPQKLYVVYLRATSAQELRTRLLDRDQNEFRYDAAEEELRRADEHEFDNCFDLEVLNDLDALDEAVGEVFRQFTANCQQEVGADGD